MVSIWIAKNIISRLFREIQTYIFLIIFPILSAFIALAMVSNVSSITVGVAGLENKEMLEYFQLSDSYEFIEVPGNRINNFVKNGEVDYGIIFPNGLLSSMENGLKPSAELVAMNNTTEATELTGFLNGMLEAIHTGGNQTPVNTDHVAELTRVGVGIMTMFIIMYIGYGVGVILEDKKEKTFMRSYSAPISSYSMVLGNLLANILLGVIQLLIFIVFSTYVLGFDWGISLINLFIILFVYMITVIGLAVGLMGFISDNEKYFAVTIIVATASCMLGGSFFPLEYMNTTLQKIANFLPQKWVMESYDVLYLGGSLYDIRTNLIILALFAIALFSFGIKTLKPQEEDL
ncbi:ABC transporter permease [Alkalicella caledoniensis]|uniref:ABC transporter permease n=1 Tax=Alkalicella caledoniensis TaxID=2731377 RepID=A0A7G9WA54_ALKCA|nr:ABC transporter permease [Alkalicella caledoniensis]QNO15566.1 ABC transporter permease [Alkalicella caledoniensis]